ncbi:MarR family winged helix-turn-helix transcriptional regulator [Kordiimonas aquimaris]|uniref:MarR family winged helix-turn-helix transcriptional regulator n=1 Tax=Kordiimonas aquimaris TaxID=707591 RepID=UPI0021CEFB63|nr:MarR family winged helix-turn-helix transcriptional regulator [Kordiimonas aquimaris]
MSIPKDKIKLFHMVSRMHQALFRASDKMLAAHAGISTTQSAVLLYLNGRAPVSIGDVAETIGIKITSMSGLIDRMEKKGLISRTRDSADMRTVLLSLTELGKIVSEETGPKIKQANDQMLAAGGSPEDWAVFTAVCERLIQKADETKDFN